MNQMNLQINGTDVAFAFPLLEANTVSNKDTLVLPISDKLQYRIEAYYEVKELSSSASGPQK